MWKSIWSQIEEDQKMNHVRRISNTAKRTKRKFLVSCASLLTLTAALIIASPKIGTSKPPFLPNNLPFKNASGLHATFSTDGRVDLRNEFFQDLGTNGRGCVTCHTAEEGWTITPAGVQERFERTGGTDPIFRTNDGANSPNADVSTVKARRAAYSMLLTKGLIRVGIGIPNNAEFELAAVDDPYGFAGVSELSLFRRPLPSTNLKFLSTVMWDGRETFPGQSIHFDLSHQANEATTGHAQGAPLTDAQRESIVAFETALFTAQIRDERAGNLTARNANGGPVNLSNQDFYIGINDLFGDSQTGAPFDPVVFNIYDAWKGLTGSGKNRARAAVARGEELFNTKLIRISNVSGINDEEAFGAPAVVNGTCTICHDTPNSGNHSVPAPLNIGLADADRRTPDMPLYTLRNKTTGETKQTTDPGRALITGNWKDIGRFKGPILRAVAARAPYFHDGSAKDLRAVIEFYDQRFGIGFTEQEKADLLAFLRTL
jgi:cytochrome c peroxidase